jgi:hypothetical protein
MLHAASLGQESDGINCSFQGIMDIYKMTGGRIRRKRHVGIPHGIIHSPSPPRRLLKHPELMDGMVYYAYLVAGQDWSDKEKMRI